MPMAPSSPCWCGKLKPCSAHPAKYRNTTPPDEKRFYQSRRWTETSLRHRQLEPFCRECKRNGRFTKGDLVDHIKPIHEGGSLFDEKNLATLCNRCHNIKRQKEVRTR